MFMDMTFDEKMSEGVCFMAMSYKKLWKLLIDKELNKKELAQLAGLSQYTINKLTRTETVTTETLEKICYALKVDIGDICEVVFDNKDIKKSEGNE